MPRRRSPTVETPLKPRRVLIVGAGAAGLACAWSLSRFPDKFEVHVWEKEKQAGGVSTSEDVGGGDWINDGVQGAAPSYHNTFLFHREFGFEHEPVHMKVAFGKGPTAWNNIAPTQLVIDHQREIERFGRVLKHIMRFKFIYAFIPIRKVLALHRFSKSFRDHLVFPLTALFFGTGNQASSSSYCPRVFLFCALRLFGVECVRACVCVCSCVCSCTCVCWCTCMCAGFFLVSRFCFLSCDMLDCLFVCLLFVCVRGLATMCDCNRHHACRRLWLPASFSIQMSVSLTTTLRVC